MFSTFSKCWQLFIVLKLVVIDIDERLSDSGNRQPHHDQATDFFQLTAHLLVAAMFAVILPAVLSLSVGPADEPASCRPVLLLRFNTGPALLFRSTGNLSWVLAGRPSTAKRR